MAVTQIPFWVSLFFFFFFFFFFFLVGPSFGENDDTSDSSSPSPPPPLAEEQQDTTPFRPSIAVIVGVLTTMFSITFLLLLYAKHCKHGNVIVLNDNRAAGGGGRPAHYHHPCTARKNSGIHRTVVESLPLFRFGSLRGQKDGLECAVCLTRFEPTEVLRLLPKCKHAFHVECVDTWLDSHSTCPLCRYRVDPEDILLIQDVNIFQQPQPQQEQVSPSRQDLGLEAAEFNPGYRRVSGRHSSAGESFAGMGTGEFNSAHIPTSCRRSLDSVRSFSSRTAVGCLERPRKDGLLLSTEDDNRTKERRLDHRIIVSAGFQQRWSDVHPSDLLYLRSEMIISDSHRFSSGSSRPSVRKQQQQQQQSGNGSCVINTRCVSEITGMSRFSSRESNGGSDMNMNRKQNHRQRQAGLVSRWLVWISSRSHSFPHPPSNPNTHTSTLGLV